MIDITLDELIKVLWCAQVQKSQDSYVSWSKCVSFADEQTN